MAETSARMPSGEAAGALTVRAAAAAASQPQVALDPVSLFAMAVIGLLLLICIGVACYCFLFKRLFEACSTGCTYCCDTCKPRCHRCCNACCWECWYPACVIGAVAKWLRVVAVAGSRRCVAARDEGAAGAGGHARIAAGIYGHCVFPCPSPSPSARAPRRKRLAEDAFERKGGPGSGQALKSDVD